jgi:hypothetical protein
MDDLMQALFNDILDRLLEKYYGQTAYAQRRMRRDEIGCALWNQLSQDQKEQLEELQRAYDDVQMAELEAMFLASFDQCKSLALSHSA